MSSKSLFYFQLVAHAALVALLFVGSLHDWLITLFVYFLTGCLGMSMTYHRLLSHKSWQAPRWFMKAGTLLAAIGLTGSPLAWCAVHRDHHRFADRAQDPHSPYQQPWWRVQFLSMFFRPNLRQVPDLLADPFLRFVHRRYLWIQVVYATALWILDPFLVISGYLAPAAILWNAGSAINTLGHTVGRVAYPCGDYSKNNLFLGLFMWGEGWHNNHHRFPSSPVFGRKWYQIDISARLISLLTMK